MTQVVLVHGWGFDASLWDALCAELPADWKVTRLDFGFFGAPADGAIAVPPASLVECWPAASPFDRHEAVLRATPVSPPTFDEPVLAVGHSLGALWWLSQAPQAWSKLLCLNGFPRFCQQTDYAPAVAPRVLARMRQRLGSQPQAVLDDFYRSVGVTGPARTADVARLDAGLAALAEWDGRATLAERAADVVALYGADDAIVPAAMSAMAFAALPAAQRVVCSTPGHALPLIDPAHCAQWLKKLHGLAP